MRQFFKNSFTQLSRHLDKDGAPDWNRICDDAGSKFELLAELSDHDLAMIGTTRTDFAREILRAMHTHTH